MKKMIALALGALITVSPALGAPAGKADPAKAKPFRALVHSKKTTAAAEATPGLQGHRASIAKAPKVNKARQARYSDASALSKDLKLRGGVIASANFEFSPGLYNVPVTSDGTFEAIAKGFSTEFGAYDDGEGHYYVPWQQDWGMGYVIPYMDVYDTETWEITDNTIEPDLTIFCTDNAVDPTNGDVYGCYYDENNNLAWSKANYKEGKSTSIRTLADNEKMFGVACDNNGQFYGVLENGKFVKVDKTTGAFTVVGDTGLKPYFTTSATYDAKSGKVIFAYSAATGAGSLWAIDPATGASELLLNFADNDEVTALEVIKPAAEDMAPAAPVLTLTTPGGESLQINCKIVFPKTTFNGSPLSGEFNYELQCNGETITSGHIAEGDATESIDYVYKATASGNYSFTAFCRNAVGKSPNAKASISVGPGVPKAPTGLSCFTGNGTVYLYWDAVTEGVDGSYVDPKAITYNLTRDGETIAEGITASSYDDKVGEPDTFVKHNYSLVAVYGNSVSEPATVSVGMGAITPPYADTFATSTPDANLYTVVNSNGDDIEWYFTDYYHCFKYDYTDIKADDWLFSPAFRLESGKIYELSFDINAGHENYTEKYEVCMGSTPTQYTMNTKLVEPTEISGNMDDIDHKLITVKPTSTGVYYFGWHAISEPNQFMIQVKNIAVSAAMVAASPSNVENVKLERDAEGLLKVSGSFDAPALDISGNPAVIGRITVTREDKTDVVAEFTNPTPGSQITFNDTDIPEMGTYTYVFTPYSSDGTPGRTLKQSVYVGPTQPMDVENVILRETETPGTVELSWDPVGYDVDGYPIKGGNVTYMVYAADTDGSAVELFDKPLTDCKVTLKVCEPTESMFVTLYVGASNLGFDSENLTGSMMTPIGKPEKAPYAHSFNETDRSKHLFGYYIPREVLYGSVKIDNAEGAGFAAQDGDDAMLHAQSYTPNAAIELFTGKIDLAGIENPSLSFYHYVISDADRNACDVIVTTADGTEHNIGKISHSGESAGWKMANFPLSDFKDKVVKVLLRTDFASHYDMYFDNLKIVGMNDIDLMVNEVTIPSAINFGKDFRATVKVANIGAQDVASYTVELRLNGKTVATTDGENLASGAEASFDFTQNISPVAGYDLTYTAKVNATGDGDESNNISSPVYATVNPAKYPGVEDLAASETPEGVALTWSAPDTTGFELEGFQDFEKCEPWESEVEGWTMIDRDGLQIGTFDNVGMPDQVGMRTKQSFFLFDADSNQIYFYNYALHDLCMGNSGSKSLVSMYTLSQSEEQDDWAISPRLSGNAQTISFYARSYHPEFLNHMEVLYSTKDSTDPSDFVTLCPDGRFEVPQLTTVAGRAEYTKYEFALPAGAQRFALRSTNAPGEGFMLMIDDVTFEIGETALTVDSYDVFRDGEKINQNKVDKSAYTDIAPAAGKHEYQVVVNYNRGISDASNVADITVSGVAATIAGITIGTEPGAIIVSGAGNAMISVIATDGTVVYRGAGDARIPVAAGLYVVKAADAKAKVLVK